MAKNEVLNAALALPPDVRVEVAEKLLDSLGPLDPEIEAAWAAEARDRFEAYERGEIKAVPGQQVFERLRQKYG
ncbi:MAG: addiction module protein [Acidobacteriota bacterium]|nr:addiction module protein [Acidobacteriota bacterium]